MTIIRAKTTNLFKHQGLTEDQIANSQANLAALKEQRPVLDAYPQRLVFELTSSCNIACVMCGRDQAEFAQTFFDLAILERLRESFFHSEEVTVCGWGEPTIHPQFKQILRHLDPYPVKKYLVTNGTMLAKLIEEIFERRIAIISISLDGSTAEVNNRIRVKSDFDRIVESIRKIMAIKKERGVSYPYVNLVTTLMRRNLTELPKMVMLAKELGLPEVKALFLTAFSREMAAETLWGEKESVTEIFSEATRLAEQHGITLKLPYIQGEDVAGELSHKPCFVAWRDFFIGSDGYVRPCQSTAMKLFPIDRYGDFMSMWNSEEYQAFRRCVNDEATMPDECRRCYHAAHANWNKRSSFIQLEAPFAPTWERSSAAAPLSRSAS